MGDKNNLNNDDEYLKEIEQNYEREYGVPQSTSIVVRGALLQCSCGTHCRRLNLEQSNGEYANDDTHHPLMHDHNCIDTGAYPNITYYGVCKSETPPENASDITLEPYIWPDGTKTSESKITGKKCIPEILGKYWLNPNKEDKIKDLDDGKEYACITTGSYLVCRNGGIIQIMESGQEFVDQ